MMSEERSAKKSDGVSQPRIWLAKNLLLTISSTLTDPDLACSRLRDGDGKSFSNKKCEKRAGAGERQSAIAPFPKSCPSYFRFARFNMFPLYYLRAWHRLTQIWWVVMSHQYGISAVVPQTSFGGKPVGASRNVGCFLRLCGSKRNFV